MRAGYVVRTVVVALLFSLFATHCERADAQTTMNAGGFVVEFWNQSDGAFTIPDGTGDDIAVGDVGTWSNAEMQSIVRALEYWSETLNLPAANADSPIFRVVKNEAAAGNNATAFSGQFNDDPITSGDVNTIARLVDDLDPNRPFGIDGFIIFDPGHVNGNLANPLNAYDTTRMTQIVETGINLEKTAVHEFGHLLGFTGANQAHIDNTTGAGGFANGAQTLVVVGGSGVPLEDMGFGHHLLNYHNLTRAEPFGSDFRNISAFAPGELAVYADMGYDGGVNADLNLNEHFGYLNDLSLPLYQNGTGTLETLANNFTTDNSYAYGLFLHADNRNVLLNGDIDLDGFAATGIRLSGNDGTGLLGNTVTIGTSSELNLSGDEGIGVLVSVGANNTIVHRGSIITSGAGSTGIYLGIGRNSLLSNFQVTSRDYEDYLVEQLDITGTISTNSGSGNAIFIDEFAAVRQINIMSGAALTGHIESNALSGTANNNAGMSVAFDRPTITFGRMADANGQATNLGDAGFSFNYAGNILGSTPVDLDFRAGSSAFSGMLGVNNLVMQGGTTTFANTSTVNAMATAVNGGILNVQTANFDTTSFTQTGGTANIVGMMDVLNTALISDGDFVVNGLVTSNLFILDQPATLAGAGTVQSTIGVAGLGTIAPGNSIGTLTILGDYAGGPTAMYDIEMDPAGQTPGVHNDLIDVTGVATIDGGTVNVLDLPGTFPVANQYTFLTAGTLTVTNPVAVNESVVDRRFIPLIEPTQYSLVAARDVPYDTIGITPNQISFGEYLEAVEMDPDIQGLRDLLDLIPLEEDVRDAFDQLDGEIYATHLTVRAQNDSTFLDILGNVTHLVADPCQTFEFSQVASAGWNASYGLGSRSWSDGNARTSDSHVGGTMVGYTEIVSNNAYVGFVYGYEDLQSKIRSLRSRVDSEVHRFGMFSEYRSGNRYLRGAAIGGFATTDAQRSVVISNPFMTTANSLQSDFDGWLGSAELEAGSCEGFGEFVVQPFAGLRYLYVGQDGFEESGGGTANLVVDDAEMNVLRSRLGARWFFGSLNSGDTRITVNTLWQYDLLGEPQGETSSYLAVADAAQFTIDGVGVGRNAFVVSPGVEHFIGRVKLFARYRAEINNRLNRQGGDGGIEIWW